MHSFNIREGNAEKELESKQDTGKNSHIDRIGGVICSDLNGPTKPKDRLGNRCLINFADHNSNYCRIFPAKTEDAVAKKFEHFLFISEKMYNYRVHMLQTRRQMKRHSGCTGLF